MTFTDLEVAVITAAIAKGGDVWNDETLYDIKQNIKTFYRNGTDGHCCYCRRRFKGEFKMDIDIEHVLPKSKFIDFMFEIFNLNISCKRCNMMIKKERIDFLVDVSTILLNAKRSDQYYFIHPNFDYYFDHMDHDVIIKNEQELVKFTPKKAKGKYTYDFFKLTEIEVNMFDNAQGIKADEFKNTLLNLPIDLQQDTERLLKEL